MKLWPSDSFEIETRLPPEKIASSMGSWVEPKKLFRFSSDHALFQGNVTLDGFKMTRIIHYRNSFLPVLRGTFLRAPAGTTIRIKMELHPLVMAFMCFWFSGVGLGLAVATTALVSGRTQLSPMLLIPLGMLAFGLALVLGGFWSEAKKQKPLLLGMFQKIESSEPGRSSEPPPCRPY
jgi:hypothetical protein